MTSRALAKKTLCTRQSTPFLVRVVPAGLTRVDRALAMTIDLIPHIRKHVENLAVAAVCEVGSTRPL